jgi:hypothetical protein
MEAVAIFSPNGSEIDLYLIDADKICRSTFSKSGTSQDEPSDLSGKLHSIFEMMNGKKFGTPKIPLFMQKAAAAQAPQIEITKVPEKHSEVVQVESPLFACFVYTRYYLFQGKFKAMLKFNLDHPAYFKKRDALIEMTKENQRYWAACILSQICV